MNVEMNIAWAQTLTVITPHCIFVCSMCCAPVACRQWIWLHYRKLVVQLKLLLPVVVALFSPVSSLHAFLLFFSFYFYSTFVWSFNCFISTLCCCFWDTINVEKEKKWLNEGIVDCRQKKIDIQQSLKYAEIGPVL